MLGLILPFLGLEIETLSPREDHFFKTYKEILQLGKGGMDDPSGGLLPPRPPPRSRKMFSIFGLRNVDFSARFWCKKLSVWLILGGFLSDRATCIHKGRQCEDNRKCGAESWLAAAQVVASSLRWAQQQR